MRTTVRTCGTLLLAGALAVGIGTGLAPAAYAGSGGGAQAEAEAQAAERLARLESPAKQLPLKRCAAAAKKAGFRGTDLLVATAVAMAESGCDPKAYGYNPPTEGCPDGSRDRGIFMINDCYNPDVDDKCAFNLQCNADVAFRLYDERGGSFQPWVAYITRVFKSWLNESRKAVKKVTGKNIVVGVIWTEGSGPLTVRKKPRTDAKIVGQLDDRAVVRIRCQTRGDAVWSEPFEYETRVWNSDGRKRYFSDGYVYTDTRRPVAKRC